MDLIIFLSFVALIFLIGYVAFTLYSRSKARHQAAKIEESDFLTAHAYRELFRTEPDSRVIDWYARIVKEFADYPGNSGTVSERLDTLVLLLQHKPLAPLTDDPEEWEHHTGEPYGYDAAVWQSKRDKEAFSHDGGKSYYLISEHLTDDSEYTLHLSKKAEH